MLMRISSRWLSVVGGLLAALTVVLLILPAPAENWPQWRGPNNDGISHEKDLPAEWSATIMSIFAALPWACVWIP